jgi:4-hydroxy-tetrahydrodipicolinate synthase
MHNIALKGTFTALVTPFTQSGEAIDQEALEALVEAQIEGGVSGLVPCGTTGESPTLTDEEQVAVIRRVVLAAKGRVPIIAGTGSFSTKKTILASKAAVAAGADGVMIVMPYYNKPSQEGLREHVLAVAREVHCPIILYNIPGRSVVDLSAEATEQICAKAPNVVALKDATGNVLRCQELKRRLGERLTVLSGDDTLTLAFGAVGGSGVISVTSNIRPREVSEVARALLENDFVRARAFHFALIDLHGLLFVEPNPAPAKAALAALGKMTDAVRAPLLPASEATRRRVIEALERLGASLPASPTLRTGAQAR